MLKSNTFWGCCIVAFLVIPQMGEGQVISFERMIVRSTMGNFGNSVRQTLDGGYIIAGATATDPRYGRPQVYLIKTNEYDDTLWTKSFCSNRSITFNDLLITNDSGYLPQSLQSDHYNQLPTPGAKPRHAHSV